jgi:hypothetical protein
VLDWRERSIGVVIGVGVVVAFVFFLSEQTVDAPSLSTDRIAAGSDHDQRGLQRHRKRSKESSRPAESPVATVRIVGGAPPPGGPAELHYAVGDRIRLSVVSDETLAVELTGYGLTRTVVASQPTGIDLEASRAGTFGLIVADSHIDVARITVGRAAGLAQDPR